MPMSPRLLRPRQTGFDPRSISGLALWLDAADSSTLYTTDAGPVTAVSSPLDIAGCALWLDGADSSAASMTLSGTNVSAWRDKSGNGRDFASTGTARPTLTSAAINGQSALSFDGVDDRLSTSAFISSGTSGMTVFVVARGTFPGTGSFLFTHRAASGGVDSNDLAIGWSANQGSSWAFGTLRSRVTSFRSSVSYTADRRFDSVDVSGVGVSTVTASFGATSSSNSHRWQGSEASSTSGTSDGGSLAGMAIGHRFNATPDLFYTGAIAEVIVFNTALSATDRARVEAYLAAKWGISGVHAPATATNDPVGAWLDKSSSSASLTQPTGASRPVRSSINGRPAVAFDGSNDELVAASSVLPFTSNDSFTIFGVSQSPASDSGWLVSNANTGGTGFGVGAGLVAGAYDLRYSVTVTAATSGAKADNAGQVWSFSNRGAVGGVARARGAINGGLGAEAEVINTFAAAINNLTLGNRPSGASAATFFAGSIGSVLVYNRELSLLERRRVEQYLATRWGITLAPQVSNADAQDWINRVYAAGGTVSATTATAVNTFCNAIDAAGIRDRFYRLNLFCGNSDANLAAVRTPLYRGQSLTGTQFGNTIDTNANFVAADYAENNGLLGNGTTKHLATGLAQTYAGSNEIHQCVGFVPNTAAGYQCMIGARYNVTNSLAHEVRGANANFRVAAFSGGNATGAYTPADGRNLFLFNASNPAANAYDTWVRGVLFDTRTLGAYNAATSANFLVFAGDTNGTPSAFFSGRADLYSIGLRFTSTAQIDAYHAAIAAFRSAMGRT